jgi:putative ABC transport system substrate-binding protein
LVEAIENNLGRKPEQASADSGYCRKPNLEALVARGIDGYVAPGRAKHPAAANGKVGGPLTRPAEIAAEFVQQKVDVIVTYGAAIATLKQATTSIPIVLLANDPVGSGLVTSLSRPGGNVTGVSLQAPESAGRRLELLRQLVTSLRRLAILFDAAYPATVLEKDNVQAAARNLGLEVEPHGTRRVEDIAPVFDALKGQADALYVVGHCSNGARIATLALNIRLPTTFERAGPVRAGVLMSYGPDLAVLSRREADFVDKILRGAKPGELPIEQPTKFNLAINLKARTAPKT